VKPPFGPASCAADAFIAREMFPAWTRWNKRFIDLDEEDEAWYISADISADSCPYYNTDTVPVLVPVPHSDLVRFYDLGPGVLFDCYDYVERGMDAATQDVDQDDPNFLRLAVPIRDEHAVKTGKGGISK